VPGAPSVRALCGRVGSALPKAGVEPQAQRLNCLPPRHPFSPPPPKTLSSPPPPQNPPNPLVTLAIYISKTWHTYPTQPAIIEIDPNKKSPATRASDRHAKPLAVRAGPFAFIPKPANRTATSPPSTQPNRTLYPQKYPGGGRGSPPGVLGPVGSGGYPPPPPLSLPKKINRGYRPTRPYKST
jgi:hypothetical protein